LGSSFFDYCLHLAKEVFHGVSLAGNAIYLSGICIESLHFLDKHVNAVKPFDGLIIEEFLGLFIN
jgi:hypothetical protein